MKASFNVSQEEEEEEKFLNLFLTKNLKSIFINLGEVGLEGKKLLLRTTAISFFIVFTEILIFKNPVLFFCLCLSL